MSLHSWSGRGVSSIQVGLEKSTIRFCGCRETTRDRDTEIVEVSDHLTERGILAADRFYILHAKLSELDNKRVQWNTLPND